MSLRATKPLLSGNTAVGTSRSPESPIRKIAQASSQCGVQGKAYAQCIFAAQFGKDGSGGSGVERGMCQTEFRAFKDCVQEKMKRKW